MTIRPTLIYLAGPIDDVTDQEAKEWREGMSEHAGAGTVFFSPAHAFFGVSPASAPAVDTANRHMINVADGLLAFLPPLAMGFGTIREIEFACRLGRPVVLVTPMIMKSLLVYDITIKSRLVDGLDALLAQIGETRSAPTGPFGIMLGPLPRQDEESD